MTMAGTCMSVPLQSIVIPIRKNINRYSTGILMYVRTYVYFQTTAPSNVKSHSKQCLIIVTISFMQMPETKCLLKLSFVG